MSYKKFSQYFGGRYMKYWYVAFAFVVIWFTVNLVNSSAVSSYELVGYDNKGNVVGRKVVNTDSMTPPERLPVAKAYRPIKPIKFLD